MEELKINSLMEFAEEVKAEIERRYDVPVILEDCIKNNSVKRLSLIIREENVNVSPTIYLEPYFEMYEQEGFEAAVNNIWESYEYHRIRENFDITIVTNFQKAKNKLVAGLVNYKMNEERLQNIPHAQFFDLAIVAFVALNDPFDGERAASALVSNTLMDTWGVTSEEVIQQALYNVRDEAVIQDTVDVIRSLGGEDWLRLTEKAEHGFLFSLSNRQQHYGAIHLMNKAAISQFADEKNVKYVYIFPSSVHEVLLLPVAGKADSNDAYSLRKIVSEVNESQLPVEQILSNNVYLYSREENDLKIV